jgi:hypothetical protein
MEVLIDRKRIELFTVKPPPKGQSDQAADANLKSRVKATAGPHSLGVTFLKKPSSLLETTRQPLNVHFNYYRHPRIGPAVYEVSIVGPFDSSGPGETPSRSRIGVTPDAEGEKDARRILTNLAKRAYRRPVDETDLKPLLEFYHQGQKEGGFEAGIELALTSLLVKPQFCFALSGIRWRFTWNGVSHLGRGACFASVVLPVEQHA